MVNKRDVYLGQKKVMHCELEAEIIEYKNAGDITVRFSNGTIKKSCTDSFKNGRIAVAKSNKNLYLGQKKLMNCGLVAEIIGYRNSMDITVRFSDGCVKKSTMKAFKGGCIQSGKYRTRVIVKRK